MVLISYTGHSYLGIYQATTSHTLIQDLSIHIGPFPAYYGLTNIQWTWLALILLQSQFLTEDKTILRQCFMSMGLELEATD
jgi:hypothetical protein